MSVEQQTDRSPWAVYQPSAAAPWNLRRVVHLHRRAGFAAPWEVLQRDLADGPQAAVGRLLSGQAAEPFEPMAEVIGDAATASGSPGRLKAWWMYRMLLTPDPLGERLTLMWHNHFATSNRKVQDLVLMREQNDLFRKHARGRFGELLRAVVKHPAMLVWLDADSNRRGAPNENLARELMELFTLGVGNYSEDDVKEAARALTGWTVADGKYAFRKQRHDSAAKRILDQHGDFDGEDMLAMLLAEPATAKRIAWRLCQSLMGENVVSDTALGELALALAVNKLNVAAAVETVLRSQLFFSDVNMRSRIGSPVEYIVGSLRALELCDPPPSTLLLAEWAARMGQDLFFPPNVGGWNGGRAWLASRTIVARANFAEALATGQLWRPEMKPDFESLARRHGVEASLAENATWLAKLLWGGARPIVTEEIVAGVGATDHPLAALVAQLLARLETQLT